MEIKRNLSIFTIIFSNGGAERVISLLLRHLKNDFNVTLILFHNIIDYEVPNEVDVIVLLPNTSTKNSLFLKIKDMFVVLFRYNKILKQKNIEIAMSFLAGPNIINGITKMWKRKKIKTIISERCFPSIMYKHNKFSSVLSKLFFPIFYGSNDKLFSNSIYINKDLKESFNLKLPMSVIYNPIEFDESIKKNPDSIIKSEVLKIVNVGSIYKVKNQHLIVNAIDKLPKGKFHITFLGNGNLKNNLKNLVTDLHLTEQVHFAGRVTNVKDYLINSDCFVLSSNTEGFPNVVLEALSVGLPVISTNCMSGPLEMLNNNESVEINKGDFFKAKYGLLINVRDEEALAKALNYFKANPSERLKYSKLGFERAKDYNLPIIYKQVKQLILT